MTGEITLAHVMAFAAVDDHAAQERVWDELSDWQLEDPDNIRDALTEDEITAKDRRVKFVTLRPMKKPEALSAAICSRTAMTACSFRISSCWKPLWRKSWKRQPPSVRKEGWKWVEVRPSFDRSEWSKCGRRYAEAEPLPADLQAELDALEAEYDSLIEASDRRGGQCPALRRSSSASRNCSRTARKHGPRNPRHGREPSSASAKTAKADIERGYVLPEDAPQKEAKTKTVTHTDEDGTVTEIEVKDKRRSSAALTESLTAERSMAISAAMTGNRDIALAAVVHSMALQVLL